MRCPRCGWIINNMTKDKAAQMKESYPKAFQPWSPKDDKKLEKMVLEGESLLRISEALGRQPSAIKKRIELLKLRSNQPEEVMVDSLPRD